MATLVTFSGTAEVNGTTYSKGDTLSVSDSLYARLIEEGKVTIDKKAIPPLKEEEVEEE